jgi:hypothetical protein
MSDVMFTNVGVPYVSLSHALKGVSFGRCNAALLRDGRKKKRLPKEPLSIVGLPADGLCRHPLSDLMTVL